MGPARATGASTVGARCEHRRHRWSRWVRRLAVAFDETDTEALAVVRNVIKNRFLGLHIVNDLSPQTPYDLELADALKNLKTTFGLTASISVVAWHRELVKMALGLSCLTFGDAYVQSDQAALLRSFLRESDPAKRATIPLRGRVGIGPDSTPAITGFWHPGGDDHLFALIRTASGSVGFVANLFGKYENVVEVDPTGAFGATLPGALLKGTCWVVDLDVKQTRGPDLVERVMLRATRGES